MIRKHGGVVVLLEKDADVRLADKQHSDLPPNTYSYRFLEKSISKGRLEDLEAYRIQTGTTREPRTYRIPFTLEDDQLLSDTMQPYENSKGPVHGRMLFQQMAAKHPRHTWQSWKERYVKRVRGNPRPGGPKSDAVQPRPADIGPADRVSTDGVSSPNRSPIQRSVDAPGPSVTSHALAEKQDGEVTDNAPTSDVETSSTANVPRHHGRLDARRIRPGSVEETWSPESKMPPIPSTIIKERGHKRVNAADDGPAESSIDNTDIISPKKIRVGKPRTTAMSASLLQNVRKELPILPTSAQPSSAHRVETEMSTESIASTQEIPQSPVGDASQPYDPVDELLLELPFFPLGSGDDEELEEGQEDEDEKRKPEDIDAWVDSRVKSGEVEDEVQALKALLATSINTKLAGMVLKHLKAGEDIPDNMPGVWTAQDDEDIQGQDARSIARVLKKHGHKYFDIRWSFLGLVSGKFSR